MEKDDPIHAAETLSSALQRIPFQDVLSWKVLTECKPGTAQIPSLNALCKRILHLNGQEGNIHEPIYGTEMRVVDIDEGTMKQFESALEAVNPALRFPSKNDYIAYKIRPQTTRNNKREHPHVIHDDPWCRIWFKQDDEYKCPKAVTRVALISPMVNSSPKSSDALENIRFVFAIQHD
ncbi:hypothetical protein COOONC_04660 [Cooperia oncophora]